MEAAQRTPGCLAPLVHVTWKWKAQGFHDVGGGLGGATLKRSENHGY